MFAFLTKQRTPKDINLNRLSFRPIIMIANYLTPEALTEIKRHFLNVTPKAQKMYGRPSTIFLSFYHPQTNLIDDRLEFFLQKGIQAEDLKLLYFDYNYDTSINHIKTLKLTQDMLSR